MFAILLATFAPLVSQVLAHEELQLHPMSAQGHQGCDMPSMQHMQRMSPHDSTAAMPGMDQHGGARFDACAFCSFVAHFPAMPALLAALFAVLFIRTTAIALKAGKTLFPSPTFLAAQPRAPPAVGPLLAS
ncbi:MAG TPA: DUF2946 domain-containing protein [Paraburkholderia sp.]|jgi:hypothetical protein